MVQEEIMMEDLKRKLERNEVVVCVIGVGYVGLPLAIEFARAGLKVVGFDLNEERVKQLNDGVDATGETENDYLKETVNKHDLRFTSDENAIKEADFVIICVPTPIKENKEPDLSYVKSAGRIVGRNIKKGCVVVLESTVYPGVTEEVLKPILEKESGLVCDRDFFVGYSPERMNPGDKEHNLRNVVKIVAGMNKNTGDVLEMLYRKVVDAGVYKTKDIKTAEAAKVIENIQRDLNIALVNELSIIFGKMNIDINDVLDAAATKWNFHRYSPGFVGGHCIPVDPYYLVYKARQIGYEPKVILAGREINDDMPVMVANEVIESVKSSGKDLSHTKILLMGLTFKRNVKDSRNAPSKNIINIFKQAGLREIFAYEPLLTREEIEKEFGIKSVENLDDIDDVDHVIVVTDHDVFRREDVVERIRNMYKNGTHIVDIRGVFKRIIEDREFV